MTDTLSPAGSGTYSSNTMYVGDGTWDSTRNDFLLPNLVGLNFATMQYNGEFHWFLATGLVLIAVSRHGQSIRESGRVSCFDSRAWYSSGYYVPLHPAGLDYDCAISRPEPRVGAAITYVP